MTIYVRIAEKEKKRKKRLTIYVRIAEKEKKEKKKD